VVGGGIPGASAAEGAIADDANPPAEHCKQSTSTFEPLRISWKVSKTGGVLVSTSEDGCTATAAEEALPSSTRSRSGRERSRWQQLQSKKKNLSAGYAAEE
jgi:hypothetical protein